MCDIVCIFRVFLVWCRVSYKYIGKYSIVFLIVGWNIFILKILFKVFSKYRRRKINLIFRVLMKVFRGNV